MENFKNIIPAQDWFFYYINAPSESKYAFLRVAVWAMNDEGETVGLVAVQKGIHEPKTLEVPPPLKGGYIHWADMNEEQQLLVKRQLP